MRKLFEEYGLLAVSLISGIISIELFKNLFFVEDSGIRQLIMLCFKRL